MKIKPKNWDNFQQYKDRKPTWIKLHRDLLNDYMYATVQIGTKATLPLLWLLASEYDDGVIEASIEEIAFRIHIDTNTVNKAISELIDKGFFINLDKDVQNCTELYKMVPREREETEREKEKQVSDETVVDVKQKSEIVPVKEKTDTERQAERVADYLLEKIRTINPSFKQPNLSRWIKDIDLAIRIDNRAEEHLIACINWIYSPSGEFWQKNILSGAKLREKFDTMSMQSKADKKKQKNVPSMQNPNVTGNIWEALRNQKNNQSQNDVVEAEYE